MSQKEISKVYSPSSIEEKWYDTWKNQGYFHSEPNKDKKPFSVVIPPPNVTGVLHMGHMLNNTIQDVLVRRARKQGYETCWVPGTDHASIATEAKVVAMLREKGLDKRDIGREEYLKHAWEWNDKYGGIILKQLEKLGCSIDWERTKFTMEPDLYWSVIHVFVDLYKKKKIYRGLRMVNWDPVGQTALSDDEVIYKDLKSKLYYVDYKIAGEDSSLTIATTRPETILGDTAICIHPEDERFKHLHGKKAIVPVVDREVPIILDDYVSMEFGTGCLKITPAHDENDYEIGQRHDLKIIDILNPDGTLSEAAEFFVGEDRFEARKLMEGKLQEIGALQKVEDYDNSIGFSERTDAIIEPRLSKQWFLSMKEISQPALKNVMDDTIRLIPEKFKNTYRHWMENVRDWCISRQLWWGHQIPAWYTGDGQVFVAETAEEALEEARKETGNPDLKMEDLTQDEDVLDTWFSSWLWPITCFEGFTKPENEDIKYYYPTNILVTAPEILFFWVARMIISGYEYMGDKPFGDVYLHGIVRDKQRRKMSKSLGNSPEPLDLVKDFGADGVRVGMLLSSPAGNDLLFDEKLVEQGRNFTNKIWNAFRLVNGWSSDNSKEYEHEVACTWMESRINETLNEVEDHFSKYRISDALMSLYKLTWDDFCGWYLEMIKPPMGEGVDQKTLGNTREYFRTILGLLHPFVPFITEEIWQYLKDKGDAEHIIVQEWPKAGQADQSILKDTEQVFKYISSIRAFKKDKNVPSGEELTLFLSAQNGTSYEKFSPYLKRMAKVSDLQFGDGPEGSVKIMVGTDALYIPFEGKIDKEAETERIRKELEHLNKFNSSIAKKLNNERFVENAPSHVVELEKKKLEDSRIKIHALEEELAQLDSK